MIYNTVSSCGFLLDADTQVSSRFPHLLVVLLITFPFATRHISLGAIHETETCMPHARDRMPRERDYRPRTTVATARSEAATPAERAAERRAGAAEL